MKKISLSIIGLCAFCIAIILPMMAFGNESNVTGWAWSYMPDYNDEKFSTANDRCKPVPDDIDKNREGCGQGLGWIKLSGTNYGVTLDSATGKFGGYAWNSWGGGVGSYLNFSPAGFGAQVDPACLQTTSPCPVTGRIQFTNTGPGWDGVVSMQGSNYGVILESPNTSGVRKMSGYAWGDHVAGWIRFDADITVTPVLCTNISGWTSTGLPTAGSPDVQWSTQGTQCIPRACKDPKALNYYQSNTISVLGNSIPVVADNTFCNYDTSGDDYCPNLQGNQTTIPPNSGGVTWERIGVGIKAQCIPTVCSTDPRIGTIYPNATLETLYQSNGDPCSGEPSCPPGTERDAQGKCCPPGRINPITNICLPGYTVDEV